MKSLATDEIRLDAALAEAGVEAVETDLAELIVELAGDTASHILVRQSHCRPRPASATSSGGPSPATGSSVTTPTSSPRSRACTCASGSCAPGWE